MAKAKRAKSKSKRPSMKSTKASKKKPIRASSKATPKKAKKAGKSKPAAGVKPRKISAARAKEIQKLEKALKANANEIKELIERGRPRGFVTDNEILYYFPKIEDNVDLLDEIYDRLEKAGIKVIETSALIDFSKDDKSEVIDDSAAFEG